MSTYAYVMVMFGGDKYLPGILVMGYTIRYCGAIYDIVVMVTNDVSESSVREMKKMNMKVVHVNYLDYKINIMGGNNSKDDTVLGNQTDP